ncbi:MAG: signal peptidase I [Dehalococcoidia bacterium]|uniref:signal peptidase I n=1 Tax=Candidatus Amarobacter glycogenicus TaxID=3140699 RepID=UPI003135508F|nr:signal peptidase I [Dehalococcoidia bacterium]
MKPRRRLTASLSSALVFVAVLTAWVLFAPPQLGGQTSYVIINGNSMEPGMHRGDLAIVREADRYETGDVVTYQHPQIGPVIHRIIGRDGARYVFQGDHNDFIDPYHPTQDELIGELWVHVPGFGSWLARFRHPVYMFGLLFVAFIGLGGAAAKKQAGKTGRAGRLANHAPTGAENTGGQPMNQMLRNWQDTVSVLAAAGVALIGLGWVAFNRPTHHDVPANIPYSQSGTFAYSAVPADGRVYDTGLATSGEPVYRRLSDQVAFRFEYLLGSQKTLSAAGSYRMVAELGDQNGWRRTMELTPETAFEGKKFTAEGTLDLAEAQTLISILEEQSGVKNEKYSVTIRPEVTVGGAVGGTPFDDTFKPELAMDLDKLQLKMDRRSDEKDPLNPRLDGMVNTLETKSTTIKLLMISLPVSAARAISVAGLGLLLAAAGLLTVAAVNQGRSPSESSLGPGRKLRTPLVNVRGSVPTPGSTRVIDVASLDDLGRIAARLGAVVLQEARPGYHAFFVNDLEVTYRFEAEGTADEHSTEPKITRRVA